ncbi:hypothetical protein LsR_01920 (plasmid) [Ligilactobacillus salivarius str. Ren]|uniref:Uncharacterized protein n=1 Tax=Ligilactobacillus salivarius str. Ren TaxID=1194971 RepID=A0A0F7PZ79_9LACO|nr:hypothetical protein LsR_01920 [Ligilactobacillus salivarius str. Ren]
MVVNVDKWLNSADKMMNFATEIMQKSFPQCSDCPKLDFGLIFSNTS